MGSNLRVEPNTESYPGRAGSRLLSALCLHGHGDRALNSPPSGSGIDGCAPVFHTGEAGSMPAARSISPPSSTLVRMRLFQSCEAGSSPAGGTIRCRGAGAGSTDPPLKRRSARECGARSNRAPGAAAVRWCTAVAHNDRAPGSSPGAATIYAGQADRVIWRGAVDAVSAVRVRGLVHRCDVMAAWRSPKPPVGVQVPAPVPSWFWT